MHSNVIIALSFALAWFVGCSDDPSHSSPGQVSSSSGNSGQSGTGGTSAAGSDQGEGGTNLSPFGGGGASGDGAIGGSGASGLSGPIACGSDAACGFEDSCYLDTGAECVDICECESGHYLCQPECPTSSPNYVPRCSPTGKCDPAVTPTCTASNATCTVKAECHAGSFGYVIDTTCTLSPDPGPPGIPCGHGLDCGTLTGCGWRLDNGCQQQCTCGPDKKLACKESCNP